MDVRPAPVDEPSCTSFGVIASLALGLDPHYPSGVALGQGFAN